METAIRAGMHALGACLLEELLAGDGGYRCPRLDCGAGHQARFVAYRTKTIDTVLGAVELRRDYYHCPVCRSGVITRDEQLDVSGVSLSPGLAAMTTRAGTAVPFAPAAALLADLAGITLTTKRVERSAEATGAAATAERDAQTRSILSGTLAPLPPPGPLPDKLYIAVDGTGLPMRASETLDRTGNTRTGGPAPGRRNSRRCSPRPRPTPTGTRSVTLTRAAMWPP